MQHNISLSEYGYCLRPVQMEDAADILALRTDPALSRYIHEVSPRVEDQQTWLERYFDREGDFYFIIERIGDSYPHGTVGLYDVANGQAEWGRWLLKPGSLGAPASALMIYRVAFNVLSLERVYCRTVAQNLSVLSFHDSCGLVRAATLNAAFNLKSGPVDAVEHRLSRIQWPKTESRLELQSARVARLNDRRANTQRF